MDRPSSSSRAKRYAPLLLFALFWMFAGVASAQAAESLRGVMASIVKVSATVPPNATSAATLGTSRDASGVVIDDEGLILTIGYSIMEAERVKVQTLDGKSSEAEIVAYDYSSGFGLLRAGPGMRPPAIKLGRSADLARGAPTIVLSYLGPGPGQVVSRREFAGYWEYLLDDAIFTIPPYTDFAGAALLDRDGRLVGIGSLLVGEAIEDSKTPGNMFIPIDTIRPILADMIAFGRAQGTPKPWLGITSQEYKGHLFVQRVTPNGPAAQAGLKADDLIVGVKGEAVGNLGDFYRKIWGLGEAGVEVPLDVLRGNKIEPIVVRSIDRYRFLRLRPSL